MTDHNINNKKDTIFLSFPRRKNHQKHSVDITIALVCTERRGMEQDKTGYRNSRSADEHNRLVAEDDQVGERYKGRGREGMKKGVV